MDAMSCLAPLPAAAFLPTPASPAIARALHYSMSSDSHNYSSSPSSSSSLLADFPSAGASTNWFAPAAPPTGLLTCDSVLVASDAAPRPPVSPGAGAATTNKRRLGLGPAAAGRAGKRRPRASKRAPTTYISTDPANFRLMVQHVTGVQAEPSADDLQMPASFDASCANVLLADCATFDGAFADAVRVPSSDADAAALHHRLQLQQQQPCYPTLDSWSVLYESGELL
ncbi:unnamed protein product [Alopecurus aequalis]